MKAFGVKPYRLDLGADPARELRRIAHAQTAKAVEDLAAPGSDLEHAVHDCRKRCKKTRALIRLFRPALGSDYRRANAIFRDAAGQLSALRDAHALCKTFDSLAQDTGCNRFGELEPVRSELLRRSDAAGSGDEAIARTTAALMFLRRGQESIDDWTIHHRGFEMIGGGLERTYQRGRDALHAALDKPSPKRLHEYRKRAKYGWYHVRLLAPVAPAITSPLIDRYSDLADSLGRDHDLAVLADQLRGDRRAFGGETPVERALAAIEDRRCGLQRESFSLGSQLHAEPAKAYRKRFEKYWQGYGQIVGTEIR